MQIVVLPQVHIQSQTAAAELADNGGHSGTRHAHFEHEDEDGVQHDVDDGAQPLGVHGEDGAAGTLQQALEHDLAEHSQRGTAADAQIGDAVIHNVVDVRLGAEEGPPKAQGQHGGEYKAHHRQENAVDGHLIGPLAVPGAQRPAQQGIDAHGGAGGQTDHQVLGREGQRHGGKGLLADLRDEHAVHDII